MSSALSDEELKRQLLRAQQNEITEYQIYSRLARGLPDEHNSAVLQRIAEDERRHHDFWREYTGRSARPRRWKAAFYYWVSRILGLTFGIKLMERGEEQAQINYELIARQIPEARKIVEDEHGHEDELIHMIEEERLSYVGSMVLGLNDALVELTGALAGFTFALQNTRLIAVAGLITGVAASFSMAASEYLSTKSEGEGERAVKAAIYTGVAYIGTVILLILPYLLVANYFVCLGLTLAIALAIIFLFNFYVSVAKDYSFRRRFLEMASLSLGVAALSFGIGFLIRKTLGIEV
ncbi:MAG: VIT1/CCC1 transporter family protein [Spirochaetales bacterium]|nr:VIT1/CCC1 transporter family protein [Spirochaetales bacterium]